MTASEGVCVLEGMVLDARKKARVEIININITQLICCDRKKKRFILVCFLPDEAPVIVSSLKDTELNSGAPYTVNCSVNGKPAPLHGEIILLRPDKNIVYVRSSDPH